MGLVMASLANTIYRSVKNIGSICGLYGFLQYRLLFDILYSNHTNNIRVPNIENAGAIAKACPK
jgi:hypothetical protein